jgi:hypothetical protein
MKFLNSRVVYSILFYLLAILLLIVSKPSIIFKDNGDIRPFGVGGDEDKTLFSFGVFAMILAIVSFYIFSVIDMIFSV